MLLRLLTSDLTKPIRNFKRVSVVALGFFGMAFGQFAFAENFDDYFKQVNQWPQKVGESVISTSQIEYNTALDQGALYFTRPTDDFAERHIMVSQFNSSHFSQPKPLLLAGKHYLGSDVSISPDGQQLYFKTRSNVGALHSRTDGNIYVSQKLNKTWSAPKALPSAVNSKLDEFYPVKTLSGNLYFARELATSSYDIFVSKWQNGRYLPATPLSAAINSELLESDAYVAPDESFMVFVRMDAKDGLGVSDLYISFNQNGQWSKAKHMGNNVNSVGVDGSPYVTADSKYLFFTSTRDSREPSKFDGALDLYVMKLNIDAFR